MKQLNWYLGISVLIHLVFVLWLVGTGLKLKDEPVPAVYEVDIVTEAPSASRLTSPRDAAATKYVYSRRGETPKSFGEIKKEKALPHVKPELSPSKIEPPERTMEPEPDYPPPVSSEPASRSTEPVAAGPGSQGRMSDEAAFQISLWKTQVRARVDRVWKTPPEISTVDLSLKTTYLLRISRSGELLDKKLLVSSGNTPFDRSVKAALGSVNRLPQPPPVLMSGHDTVEVTLSFTPPKGAN